MPVQSVTVTWGLFKAVSGTARHATMHTQITPLAIWSDQEVWAWLGIDDERQQNMKLQLKIDEKSKENAQVARELLLVEKQLLRFHK